MSRAVERAVAAFLGEAEINWETLKPIMCFVVLWNRLEFRHGQHLNVARLESSAASVAISSTFDILRYEPHLIYFRERYLSRHSLFAKLFRHDTPRQEQPFKKWLEQMVRGDTLLIDERLKAIVYIPYRIRNNLFHGRKDTSQLYTQSDLFTHVNEVLCLFHSDLDEAGENA